MDISTYILPVETSIYGVSYYKIIIMKCMIKIESKTNEKIKVLKKLHLKKYRDKFSLFFVENFKIIRDGLESGICFKELFVSEEFLFKHEDELKLLTKHFNGQYYLITRAVNKEISLLDNPSGIYAVYGKKKKEIDLSKNIVYLNGVSDPGNLGTIIRTALAFDYYNIVVDEQCADVYNPKTIQASKDSIFKVNVVQDKNLKILELIKKEMKIYTADMGGSESVADIKKLDKSCLIFGSEAHGISDEIKKISDGSVGIKINKKIESLNVAIAAGILLYDISKKI